MSVHVVEKKKEMFLPALEVAREVLSSPSTLIFLIEPELKLLKPFDLLFAVVCCSIGTYDSLDDDAAVLMKLISPVPIHLRGKINEIVCIERHWRGLRLGVRHSEQ